MNNHKKITKTINSLIISLILLITLSPSVYAQQADIQTIFFTPPERAGFFKIDIAFKDYVPPAREIIFIYIPGGEQQQDTEAINAVFQFIKALNPNDVFRIIYPVNVAGIFDKNVFNIKESQNFDIPRWLHPSAVRRKDINIESLGKELESLKNAVPINIPQKIIRMIEKSLIQIKDSSKHVTEIVVVISPPKEGYNSARSNLTLIEGLPKITASLDLSSFSDIVPLKKIPRLSFLLLENCNELEKTFRQLAYETEGFFININNQNVEKAAKKFQYDFFRTLKVSSDNDYPECFHNDMWDIDGEPGILTLTGRCVKAGSLKLKIQDNYGGLISEKTVEEVSGQNPDIAKYWARIRLAEIERRILAYGGSSFDYTELAYLKRELNQDFRITYPNNFNDENNTKKKETAGSKKIPKDVIIERGDVPSHSVLEEIIPADSAYALFSSVPVAFKFLDSLDKILRDVNPAVASSIDILSIENRVKKQLSLDYNRGYYILYHLAVGEVAVATDDMSIPSNPQITFFLSLRRPLLTRLRIAEYRTRMQSRYRDLREEKLIYNKHSITYLRSDSAGICSYVSYIKFKKYEIAIVSNSLASIKKALDTSDKKLPSAVNDELFSYFRGNVPYRNGAKNGHTAYIGINKAFVNKVKSEKYAQALYLKRRTWDTLTKLNDSIGIFKREFPDKTIKSFETLSEHNIIEKNSINDDDIIYDENKGLFISKRFGSSSIMSFIEDVHEQNPENADSPQISDSSTFFIKPLAVGFNLNRKKLDFNVVAYETEKGTLFKLVESIFSKKPVETAIPMLDWDGYLFSLNTDLFAPRAGISLSASKEQIMLRGILTKLRASVASAIKWKSSKDIFSWMGSEIIVGFRDLQSGWENFLYNSQGFMVVEIRDASLAREFLVAYFNACNEGKPARKIFHQSRSPNEENIKDIKFEPVGIGYKEGFPGALSYAGIVDKWMVFSNDRSIFNYITEKLATNRTGLLKTEMPFNARLVFGNNDAAKIFLSGFFQGKVDIHAKTYLSSNKDVFSENFPPLYKRHIYPAAGSRRLLLDLSSRITGDWVRFRGTLYLDIPKRKKSRRTLEEMQELYSANRFYLSQPLKLAVFLAQREDGKAAEFLETQATKLGWSEGRRLLTKYLKGDDLTKIYALKLLRELDSKSATKELARIWKKSPPKNPQVRKEMNRTLIHLREKSIIRYIGGCLSSYNIKMDEFETVEKERIPELAKALANYINNIDFSADEDREISRWLSAEFSGSKNKLGLCISSLSAIGKKAMPEILKVIQNPYTDNRRTALFALAVLSMPDIGKDDLIALKENAKHKKVIDFLDMLIEEFE